MIVAAHQPHFLPWLGYLYKVACADLFVVMDDLQFESQNYQNRNRVKVNNGTTWLTVPLVRGPQSERICDKRVADVTNPKDDWRRRAVLTLSTHYGKAECFRDYAPEIEAALSRAYTSLLELDLHMLRLSMDWLGITTPVVLASTLSLEGQKTARIVQMCQRVGAATYLSGSGGSKGYLEMDRFGAAGIEVRFQEFDHPLYTQRYPDLGFIKNLAALDLLLNCGAASRGILLGPRPGSGPVLPRPEGETQLGKPIL
jgi:WbqC-like protein family